MKHTDRKRYPRWRRWIFTLAVLVFSISLYVSILPESILPGDSGELIAASQTMSIAHPPGYPLYLMLAKVFASVVGWGSVAFRYNLLSSVVAAFTAALIYLMLREIGVRYLVSMGIALAIATHQAFWLQAAVAEVYALNAFLTAALFLTAAAGRRYGERSFLVLAYLGGLAVSHHLTLIYSLAAALLLALVLYRRLPRAKTVVGCIFLGLLGLTAWLYIPIRAQQAPPFTWGSTDTLKGFIDHITASRYAWRLKTFDLTSRLADFLRFFRVITSAFGVPLMLLAALGAAASLRRFAVAAGALAVVVLAGVHYAAYNIPDIEGHILPALIGIGILAAIGVEQLIARLRGTSRVLSTMAAVAVLAIPAANLITLSPREDPWLAHDYAKAIALSARTACGPSPVVITAADLAGLSLAYVSYVEDPDLVLYIQGISHPSVIGSNVPTRSVAQAVEAGSRNFGEGRVCILGGVEAEAVAQEMAICGMVSVPAAGALDCPSPDDYEIRGLGEESRDFFSRALSAEYYIHLARWHARNEEADRAIADLDRAVDLARGDAQTYVDASRLYLELDRAGEAERLLRQAVAAEPTHFFAHFALANVLQMDGRIEEAAEEYRKALRGNPQPAPGHVNLGNIRLSDGRYAEAMEHFSRALDLEEANVPALLGMAGALESAGKPQEALEYLDRAIVAGPGQASAYHAKASILIRSGFYEESWKTLARGLAEAPDDPVLLSDMGLYFLRTDRPDSAAGYLGRALEDRPDLLTALGNLAVAYERMGMIGEAIEHYEKYAQQAPPGPRKQMAERALKELRGSP